MARERFRLRPMQEEDLDGVLAIEKATYPTPWSRAAFLGEIHGGDACYSLVASQRPAAGFLRVAGYICTWIVRDVMQVNNVAVHEECRRLGLGEGMMRRALEEGVRRGARACFLDVRVSNVAALHLYRKLGFEEVGRRRGYYRDTREDALVMRLALEENG